MIFRALFFEHDAEIRQKGHLWTGTNYDPVIETAAVPVVTGIIVVVLALFGLVPEFVVCERCGRRSFGTKKGHCRYCEEKA